jgi:hypothetical protein
MACNMSTVRMKPQFVMKNKREKLVQEGGDTSPAQKQTSSPASPTSTHISTVRSLGLLHELQVSEDAH